METRVCKKCDVEKDLNEKIFRRNGVPKKDGTYSFRKVCRECDNKKTLKYYHKNSEEILKYNRGWKDENKEKVSEHSRRFYEKTMNDPELKHKKRLKEKEWRDKNPDYGKIYHNEYYKENKDKLINRVNDWAERNKDKVRIIKRNWSKNNPDYTKDRLANDPMFKLKHYSRSRVSIGIRRNGYSKNSKTADLLGCSWDDLKIHLESQFSVGMSIQNYGEWHIDHRIPLAAADSQNEIEALCHFTNIQPMWASENLIKNDSYNPEDKRKYLEWYSANVKKID